MDIANIVLMDMYQFFQVIPWRDFALSLLIYGVCHSSGYLFGVFSIGSHDILSVENFLDSDFWRFSARNQN